MQIKLNHVVGWQSRSFLIGLLLYSAKNMAFLVQKIVVRKKVVQIRV